MTRKRNCKRKLKVAELIRQLRKVCPQFIGQDSFKDRIVWKDQEFYIRLTRTNEWIISDRKGRIIHRTLSDKKIQSYLRTLVLINP